MPEHLVGLGELLQPISLEVERDVATIHVLLVLRIKPRCLLHGADQDRIGHNYSVSGGSIRTGLVFVIKGSGEVGFAFLWCLFLQVILAWTGR